MYLTDSLELLINYKYWEVRLSRRLCIYGSDSGNHSFKKHSVLNFLGLYALAGTPNFQFVYPASAYLYLFNAEPCRFAYRYALW